MPEAGVREPFQVRDRADWISHKYVRADVDKNPKAKQSEMLELLSLTSENSFSCAE